MDHEAQKKDTDEISRSVAESNEPVAGTFPSKVPAGIKRERVRVLLYDTLLTYGPGIGTSPMGAAGPNRIVPETLNRIITCN